MDCPPKQNDTPLRQQSSSLSDFSIGSTSTVVASPPSPTFHRPGYRRIPSVVEENTLSSADKGLQSPSDECHGLGIGNLDGQKRSSISRVPVGRKNTTSTPGSADPLLSPTSAKLGGRLYLEGETPHERDEDNLYDPSGPNVYQPFTTNSEGERLHKKAPSALKDDRDFTCKSKKPLATGRAHWLAITVLILSIYSTVFSAIWLFIAIVKPRYGHTITTAGSMTPQTASVLCAAFAKSIELSFVTVFVAVLGQILTKRALGQWKSVTIAEMSMRSWVMQPGTMITHWESVRYAAVTVLGVIALLAASMAMIYTTASDALVAPKLKFGKSKDRLIYGAVSTEFANAQAIMARCTTPISPTVDPANYGQTCIQIEHSGEAYHNYMQYLGTWVENIDSGNGSTDLKKRPDPVAMLYDNTTVKGSWVNVQNMTKLSAEYKRNVNNVTMAMPHSGVFGAARDPLNGIIQPKDPSGLGEYYIQASVPSPMVNVLCADLTLDELTPMVYTEWPEFNGTQPNSITWPFDFNLTIPSSQKQTAVDNLFEFDEIQVHPIFPKRPLAFNTVFNASATWGPQAVYLLATSPTNTSTLCAIRTAISPNCSTIYHSSMSGGSLNSKCEDWSDHLLYTNSYPHAANGIGKWSADWVDVASEWGLALSLGAGITDGASTNARLLTQLIPTSTALDPSLPSISEALAVLAGNTLLLSSLDSPFIHYWNYSATVPTLKDPQYQAFNASFRASIYQSGGTQHWQGLFYIVLLLVFLINLCCFSYLLLSGGLVTDFIEPQNLFCLSLNSPPSEVLEGTCGGGPEKEHFSSKWNIKLDRGREHFEFESNGGLRTPVHKHKRSDFSQNTMGYEMEGSPMARMYSRIRKKRTSML